MEEIPFGNQLHTRTIQVSPIEMLVIRIFAFFFSVSQEVNYPAAFVHFHNLIHMPRTGSNAVLQVSFAIIQIQMCPTVTFAPMNQFFPVLDGCQRTHFLISIHPFFYQRTNGILSDGIRTNVNAMQVAAGACQVKMIVVA